MIERACPGKEKKDLERRKGVLFPIERGRSTRGHTPIWTSTLTAEKRENEYALPGGGGGKGVAVLVDAGRSP